MVLCFVGFDGGSVSCDELQHVMLFQLALLAYYTDIHQFRQLHSSRIWMSFVIFEELLDIR